MTVANGEIILAADLNATTDTVHQTLEAGEGTKGNDNMISHRWPVLFRWRSITQTAYGTTANTYIYRPMCDYRLVGIAVDVLPASGSYTLSANIDVRGGDDTVTRYLRGKDLTVTTATLSAGVAARARASTLFYAQVDSPYGNDEMILFGGVEYQISVKHSASAKTSTKVDVVLTLETRLLKEIVR